jgi:hypothetical protein
MDNFTFAFPFTKVNKDKRLVCGIATGDNLDQSNDEVDFNASLDAFNNWVGNIREMHGREAVGKSVTYRPVVFNYNGETHQGIEVEAYISKGAPNTWEKVLDGTLRGFSIGGNILDKEYIAKNGTQVRRITKYDLGELSLVDNPDNPAALISMVKRGKDGTLTMEVEKDSHTIYHCYDCNISKVDDSSCSKCDDPMPAIGSMHDEVNLEVLTKAVDEWRNNFKKGGSNLQNNKENDNVADMDLSEDQRVSIFTKLAKALFSGSDTADLLKSTTILDAPATPAPVTININGAEVTKAAEKIEEKVEEAAEEVTKVAEQNNDGGSELDAKEMMDAFSAMLDEKLTKVKDDVSASVDEKIEAITKSVDEVAEKIEKVETATTEAVEKVNEIDEKSAVKKSVDATDDEENNEKVEKSASSGVWGNLFLPQGLIEAYGRDS